MRKLLGKDAATRFAGADGLQDIKGHPWFAEFDWHGLVAKTVRNSTTPYERFLT